MSRITLARAWLLIALSTLALVLVACERRSINQILADPHRYAHRDVGVVGTVVQSYSVLGRGAYQIEDGTGKLWVVSYNGKGVPRKGARVGVKGKIQDGFDLGTVVKLPEVVSSGLVMVESTHKASI
jgi:membrane protein implicated in regulation of membrane protease activity